MSTADVTIKRSQAIHRRTLRWLRWRMGYCISRVGETIGMRSLVYNRLHFLSFHDHAIRNAFGVIASIRAVFPSARSYLDVGAGSGAFAAEARRNGLTVVGCEHSPAGRRLGLRQGVELREFDLTASPPADVTGQFDIAYCFEVAEHLPPALGDKLVEFIAGRARTVIFTAAQPGQRGTGHVNEQPREYWIERFEANGMRYREDTTRALIRAFAQFELAPWFAANVMILESQET